MSKLFCGNINNESVRNFNRLYSYETYLQISNKAISLNDNKPFEILKSALFFNDVKRDGFIKACYNLVEAFKNNRLVDYLTPSEILQEMADIRAKAIADGRIKLKADGTFDYALAPNGKKSNLNERQWLQVRTKAFKDWFGDWEKDAANASKVVDENDEPLVVYHGSKDNNFVIFDRTKNDKGQKGFFFTNSEVMASSYGKNPRAFFLNAKDPYIIEGNGHNWNDISITTSTISKDKLDSIRLYKNQLQLQVQNGTIPKDVYDFWNNKYFKKLDYYNSLGDSIIDKIKKHIILKQLKTFKAEGNFVKSTRYTENILELDTNDVSMIFNNITDYGPVFNAKAAYGSIYNIPANVYVVTNPNQIKSATDNVGTFSRENDDIRFNREAKDVFDVLSYTAKTLKYIQNPTNITDSRTREVVSKIHGKFYLTKSDVKSAERELENYRLANRLPKGIFHLEAKGKSIEVTLDKSVLIDAIERNQRNVNFSNLFESAEEAQAVKDVLDFLAAKTGLKYETISFENAKRINKNVSKSTNAFVHNGTCYFIEGRKLNVDIAAEEMLHPFIAAMKIQNPRLFENLLKEAQITFPKLRFEIAEAYKDRPVSERQEELVTQALSRAFRTELQNHPQRRSIKALLEKFVNWIRDILRIGQKDYILTDEIDQNTTLQDLAKILNTELTLWYNSAYKNITRFNTEETTKEAINLSQIETQPSIKSNEDIITDGYQMVYFNPSWIIEHGMTQMDFFAIQDVLHGEVTRYLSMFLYEFDTFCQLFSIPRDENNRMRRQLKKLSDEQSIHKLLQIESFTFADLYAKALLSCKSLKFNPKEKSSLFDLLADDSKNTQEIQALNALLRHSIYNLVKETYDIPSENLAQDKIIKKELLNAEFDIEEGVTFEDELDTSDEVFDDSTDIESIKDDDDSISEGEEDELADSTDHLATLLAAQNSTNIDRIKNQRKEIEQLLSGIYHISASIISPYGDLYYDPYEIFTDLLYNCHNCKTSSELVAKIKSLQREYNKELLTRISQSPKFASLLLKQVRGQFHIFSDIVYNENSEIYKLSTPNFNYGGDYYKRVLDKNTELSSLLNNSKLKLNNVLSLLKQIDIKIKKEVFKDKNVENLSYLNASNIIKQLFEQYNRPISSFIEKVEGDRQVSYINLAYEQYIKNFPNAKNETHSVFELLQNVFNSGLRCYELGINLTSADLFSLISSIKVTRDSNNKPLISFNKDGFSNLLNQLSSNVSSGKFEIVYSKIESNLPSSFGQNMKIIKYFFRGRDGYYSFGYNDKTSRFDYFLHSCSNKEYIDWYEENVLNDYFFEAYNNYNKAIFGDTNSLQVSEHSLLYKLYVEAKKGNSEDLLIQNPVKYSFTTFAVMTDKTGENHQTFGELKYDSLKMHSLLHYINRGGGIHDSYAQFPIYALSDKNRSLAFINNREKGANNVLNPYKSLQAIGCKVMMELVRMRMIYQGMFDADGKLRDDLLVEPNFTPKLVFNPEHNIYEVDLSTIKSRGGIRFAFFGKLNKYLKEINNIVIKDDRLDTNSEFGGLNHAHNFSKEEISFIANLRGYIYGKNNSIVEARYHKIIEQLIGDPTANRDPYKYVPQGILDVMLFNEAKDLENYIKTHPQVFKDLGFEGKFDTKTNSYLDGNLKQISKGLDPLAKITLERLCRSYLYEHTASLAEQVFIFNNDPVRYGTAKAFSKRQSKNTSNGEEVNFEAEDRNGLSYEAYDPFSSSDRPLIIQHKRVSLTTKNVKFKLKDDSRTEDSGKALNTHAENFYKEIGNAIVKYGSAGNRAEKVKEKVNDILTSDIEAADGQTITSLMYERRINGQLDRIPTAHEEIYERLIMAFKECTEILESSSDERELEKRLEEFTKNVLNPLYEYMDKENFSIESRKQFSSDVLNNPETRRSTATERKNSEVCLYDIKRMIQDKDYFLIKLNHYMNYYFVDALDDETVVKEGTRDVFNPSTDNYFEALANEFGSLRTNPENASLDVDMVNLIDMNEVMLTLDKGKHFQDVNDIFGTQIARLLPATIDFEKEYTPYTFEKESENGTIKQEPVAGGTLYYKIQKIYDLLLQKRMNDVYKELGLSQDLLKLVREGRTELLTQEQRKKINNAIGNILKRSASFSSTEFKFIQDSGGNFMYPLNESSASTEISKAIISYVKRKIINLNVPGGHLIQVSGALKEIFTRLKNKEKIPEELLDNTLQCKVEKYNDGSIKEVYMEAEVPFQYKDALQQYMNENGEIDIDKVPEEMRHIIMYRIPTEGLCSIFHVKVKRFTYANAGQVKLPAEITKLAGLDFDIDTLNTFIASFTRDAEGNYIYDKPDLKELANNETKSKLNNALFELMLTALNNPTGLNGYIEYGGYGELKNSGLVMYIARNTFAKAFLENNTLTFKEHYDYIASLPSEKLNDMYNETNLIESTIDPETRCRILSDNFAGKDLLSIGANNHSVNAELSQKNCYLDAGALASGVKIGDSVIPITMKNGRHVIKFAPKVTANNTDLCSNISRQLIAAAADTGKDSFLGAIGFNEFTVGVWCSLKDLGVELEDILLIMNNPVTRYLSEKFNEAKLTNNKTRPLDILEANSIASPNKLNESQVSPIELDRDFLINALQYDYSGDKSSVIFGTNTAGVVLEIEKILNYCLKLNSDAIELSKYLKVDSKSNTAWNSVYGYIAFRTNFNLFMNKVGSEESLLTRSFSDLFNSSSPNSIPRLSRMIEELPQELTALFNMVDPSLFKSLSTLCDKIVKTTGRILTEKDVKDIFNSYRIKLFGDPKNMLHKYFTDTTLQQRNDRLTSIKNLKRELISQKEFANNDFLRYLFLERASDSTIKKYSSDFSDGSNLNSYKLSIDPKFLSEEMRKKISEGILQLLYSNNPKAIELVNKVFIESIFQTGFNKYDSRSPLRFFNEASLYLVLNGDYMRYFRPITDPEYIAEVQLDQSNNTEKNYEYYIKTGEYTRSGSKLDEMLHYILRSHPNLLNYIRRGEKAQEGMSYKTVEDKKLVLHLINSDGSLSRFTKIGLKGFNLEFNNNEDSMFKDNVNKTTNKNVKEVPHKDSTDSVIKNEPHTSNPQTQEKC